VAVVKNTLRILSVDNVGEAFNQSISRLRYTPRRLLIHPDFRTLIVAESDYQAVPIADNPELQKRLTVGCVLGGRGVRREPFVLPVLAVVTCHFALTGCA
jgi:splicing factor 3B subunit 3